MLTRLALTVFVAAAGFFGTASSVQAATHCVPPTGLERAHVCVTTSNDGDFHDVRVAVGGHPPAYFDGAAWVGLLCIGGGNGVTLVPRAYIGALREEFIVDLPRIPVGHCVKYP